MTPNDLISEIIEREGREYTNRPADKGGPTKFGITLSTLSAWRGRPCTAADVEALDEPEARDIYLKNYVQKWGYDKFSDEHLQGLMTDWCVTSGPDNPTRALQSVLRVPVDGAIGPRTFAAYLIADKRAVYLALFQERVRQMVAEGIDGADVQLFIKTHPSTDLKNVRGWVNRALEFAL